MSTLLRLATAGSVDDGKSTLVGRLLHDIEVGAHRPAGRRRAGQPRPGPDRRRPRAAHRRPARRARAGHHHRRRLPLLRHGAALVRPRRLPRPRAVHPQHRDRVVDGRRPRAARRRPQGRARADPPPPRRRRAACGCRTSSSPSTRSTSSTTARRSSAPSPPRCAPSPRELGIPRRPRRAGLGARRRQRRRPLARNTPWYDGPSLLELLETLPPATDPRARVVPDAGAARHPPAGRRPLARARGVPRVCRPARLRLGAGRRRGGRAAVGLAHDRRRASTSASARSTSRSRRSR